LINKLNWLFFLSLVPLFGHSVINSDPSSQFACSGGSRRGQSGQ